MDIEMIIKLLPLANIPVVVVGARLLLVMGKWTHIFKRLEKHCCVFTLRCPMGGHYVEEKEIAGAAKRKAVHEDREFMVVG